MAEPREVVVTGLGLACPLGVGGAELVDALLAGQSGITFRDDVEDQDQTFSLGAVVPEFNAGDYIKPRKALKLMCREIQAACAAAAIARQSAGITDGSFDPDRVGVVMGSELLYAPILTMAATYRSVVDSMNGVPRPTTIVEPGRTTIGGITGLEELSPESASQWIHRWPEAAAKDLFPLWMLQHLPNMAACHIGIAMDARGPCNSIILDEISSHLAIIEGTRIIQRGRADMMIVGGLGSTSNVTTLAFRGDRQLSRRYETPDATPRPFERHRDGTVLGEGAAVLVLEERQAAMRRGAPILATLTSSAQTTAGQGTIGQAIERSIATALKNADRSSSGVDFVSAHAGGWVERDATEAGAIRAAVGDCPVSAIKGQVGTIGAGGGAVEAAFSILALQRRQIPLTRNYVTADPGCPVNASAQSRPISHPVSSAGPSCLTLAHNQAGQASALLWTAPDT